MSNGDTIISSTNFEELFKPQQIVPPGQFYPSQQLTQPNWRTYGLGWFQHDYKGQKVDFHTGSLPGMVAIAGLIREGNLGVYVFSNLDHVELRHAIMYAAFDLFTEGKLSRNWSDDLKAIYDERIDEDVEPLRIENAPPIIPTDSLIGTYINKQRGKIDITRRGSDLRFSLNETITGSLSHWHYDVYQLKYDRTWYGEGMVNFRMNSAAKIEYLELWGLKFTKTDN